MSDRIRRNGKIFAVLESIEGCLVWGIAGGYMQLGRNQ